MTDRYAELRALLEKAPKDWIVERRDEDDGSITYALWSEEPLEFLINVNDGGGETDAKTLVALIARAHNALPALIDENKRMRLMLTLDTGMFERALEALDTLDEMALGEAEDEDSIWPIRNELIASLRRRLEDSRALLASLDAKENARPAHNALPASTAAGRPSSAARSSG